VREPEWRAEVLREALVHYAMKPYPGHLHLFRPPLDARHDLGGGRFANSNRERIDHQNFWTPWVSGGIDVHVVTGDHDSLVLEPSVRVLGARVRAVLEGAQHSKPEGPPAR
jgi:thioesterase domain-containing protein